MRTLEVMAPVRTPSRSRLVNIMAGRLRHVGGQVHRRGAGGEAGAGAVLEEEIEEGGVEAAASGEAGAALAEEGEAEGRLLFGAAQELGREVLVGLGDGHEDEGAPADAEQVFEGGGSVGQLLHGGADALGEREELEGERVEGLVACGGVREEGHGAAVGVFAEVLEVVAELEEDTPVEGEAAFGIAEPGLGETGVGEDGGAAFGAAEAE